MLHLLKDSILQVSGTLVTLQSGLIHFPQLWVMANVLEISVLWTSRDRSRDQLIPRYRDLNRPVKAFPLESGDHPLWFFPTYSNSSACISLPLLPASQVQTLS